MKVFKSLYVVFLIMAIIVLLFSCNNNDDEEITISKKEYQKLTKTPPSKYPKPFKLDCAGLKYRENGIVLGSNGHEYLIINYTSNSQNIEHYIECEKCMDNNKKK